MEQLLRLTGHPECGTESEYGGKVLPYYRALYSEAQGIVETREQKLRAIILLQFVEKLEIGSSQSWVNYEKRKRELQ